MRDFKSMASSLETNFPSSETDTVTLVAPVGHVCDFLVAPQRAPDFEHIHVVVVAAAGVGLDVEVLLDDALHGLPRAVDVPRRSPRVADAVHPRPRIGPSADIEDDGLVHFLSALLYGLGDAGVLEAVVEVQVDAAAVVYLDEIEIPFVEVQLTVLFFMAVEAYSETVGLRVSRATGVVAGVGIDTGQESFLVDVVRQVFHATGKEPGVENQLAVGTASIPETVVNINIGVSGFGQARPYHGVGLLFDETLADIEREGVP